MKRPHASDDVRRRALAAIDAGKPVAEVASCIRCDPSTLRRWIRQRTRTGSGLSRPRSGRPRLIRLEQAAQLRQQVADHPDATLVEHCRRWAAATGSTVSLSTMSMTLRRLGITLKKDGDRAGTGCRCPRCLAAPLAGHCRRSVGVSR